MILSRKRRPHPKNPTVGEIVRAYLDDQRAEMTAESYAFRVRNVTTAGSWRSARAVG